MPEKLSEILRQKKVEIEKYWTKVSLEFIWWVWDKEKWVSLTGSASILTIEQPDWKILKWIIDFGMFQWCENELKYNEILPFDLSEIDFVILTHTHMDHIWKTLHFSKDEFMWTIWTTKINKEVLGVMLSDAVKLQPKNKNSEIEILKAQIKNLKWLNVSKHWKDAEEQMFWLIEDLEEELIKKEKELNLEGNKKDFFDFNDINKVLNKVNAINKYDKVEVWNNIQLSFIKGGHLPWSGQAILKVRTINNKYITIWFSGDIWKIRYPAIWGIPTPSKEKLDLYVLESTYAWRSHPNFKKEIDDLVKVVNETIKKWGKIIPPVFMQWRAQEMLLFFETLMRTKKISRIPIFYHSESINKISQIYARYNKWKYWLLIKNEKFQKAVTWKWKRQQKHFDTYKGSAIVFPSWWMMNGGAVENYLHYLEDPKNLFISTWYQWEWTLWREIFINWIKKFDHDQKWRLHVNAKLHNLRWFSWHADEEDLIELISRMHFTKDAKIVINHWEKWVSQTLFWLAIKWVVWRTKEILLADFNENLYKKN